MASAFDDPMAPSTCEQCGKDTEDTMRCSVQDSKNLCQGCFQDLPQARREDIGDQIWFCDIHLDRKADIFCESCQLGCCKECAVDVHQGHTVEDVLKLEKEIRRDLNEHFQEVGVRAEERNKLRGKIESSLRKIEEASKFVDIVVDEIKIEIAQNLEKENNRIERETEQIILHQLNRRDNMLKLAKEKADLDIQRIQEIQRGISTALLEDAEKRTCKLQKAKSKLLVGQQACESLNLQIKSMLESTPEKLVCEGRQLGSLVKASLAFQCHNEVLESCKEVEADRPQLKMEKDNCLYGFRPVSPFLKSVLCIFVVFFYAYATGGGYTDKYNRLLSSEPKNCFSLILLCAHSTIPVDQACMCFVLTLFLAVSGNDCPITRIESFMKKFKSFFEISRLIFEYWALTVLLLILVSFPLYFFQVESVSTNVVYIMTFLQPFVFLNNMRHSKTFKDYCDYLRLHKI